MRQPRVIAEVIGGILLGPSVMGRIPKFQSTIFPTESLPMLNLLANIGLVLFLFIIGVELNPKILLKNGRTSLTISIAGIALPFVLGIGVGYGLYTRFGDPAIPFSSYLIFIGVAMSITAFPVLARILTELNLLRTVAGLTAFSSGVVDDVAAWVLLALVVTIINSSNMLIALYILLLAIAWILVMVFAVRPGLLFLIGNNENGPTLTMTAITLFVVFTSAFFTNIIGIHAIFGGFLAGVIMPHEGGFAVGITEKIEDLVGVLFLPIYFALSGLKTQIGLLSDPSAFGWAILVIVVAMFGKISGCTLAAKLNGLTQRESFTVGIFMSCKGLVELIVLNIGYDAGIIDSRVFVIMVIMALITTFATTPLAVWIYPLKYQRKLDPSDMGRETEEKVGSSDTTQKSSTKENKNLLVILDKVEFLPAMMTLIQLLQPSSDLSSQKAAVIPTSSSSRDSTTTTTTVPTPPTTTARNSVVDKRNSTVVTTIDTAATTTAATTTATDKKRKDSTSTLTSPDRNSDSGLTVHVLRLVELTQRISTVIKFSESEETILHDPIMNVFRTFGKLNFINVKANLAIVSRQDFAQQISNSTEESNADLVIVPWSGAGAVIDDPSNMFEEIIGTHKNKITNPQVSHYIQGVFNVVTEHADVFVFVDRGLGFSRQRTSEILPIPGVIKVFIPFFGGKDDRAALKFAMKLIKNPNVTVEIIRIMKSDVPTVHDAVLETNLALQKGEEESTSNEPSTSHRPSLSQKDSMQSAIVIDGHDSDKLDDELIEEYFGKSQNEKAINNNRQRISYDEIRSSTPLQTAVEKAKKIVERKDLVIIGRGRTSGDTINHRAEFLEVIKNIGGSYGDETRRSLGDLAESFLFGGVSSSILVVQSKKNSSTTTASTSNDDDAIIETGLPRS